MKHTNRASYAALLVALLALVVALPGAAEAARHTIGKNLVVTKSIKKNAVTGVKVKDGSLTSADLAPGTIPTLALSAKSVVTAGAASTSPTAGATFAMPPAGPLLGGVLFTAQAPVTMRISDLHAQLLTAEGPGESRTVSLMLGDLGSTTPITSCTITSGSVGCSATGQGTIPAGSLYYILYQNGPGGGGTSAMRVSYAVVVP